VLRRAVCGLANVRVIIIDGKALVWRLPEQMKGPGGQKMRLLRRQRGYRGWGDFEGLYAVASALAAFFSALGLTPVLVMEGWGDEGAEFKAAGSDATAHRRPVPDRIELERAMLQGSGVSDAAAKLRLRGQYGWETTRLAATESELTAAFAAAGVQVRVTMGEADLVWEARQRAIAAVLTG